jgi:hypothetical protein
MAEYTNFGFMRPGEDGPVKRFFKRVFRPQRGLVGDIPVTRLAKTAPVKKAVVKEAAPKPEPQLPPFEREREVMKRWVEHPSYKGRLEKELYGEGPVMVPQGNVEEWEKVPDKVREEMARDRINEEYAKRLSQIPGVQAQYGELEKGEKGEYNPTTNILTMQKPLEKSPLDLGTFYHEFTHALDNQRGFMGMPARSPFTEVKEEIITEPGRLSKEYQEKYGKNYLPAVKELQETLVEDFKEGRIKKPDYLTDEKFIEELRRSDPFGNILYKPKERYGTTQQYIDEVMQRAPAKKMKEIKDAENKIYRASWMNYINSDPEIKARINGLRIQAFDKYNYDPNKPFRIQDYPELKKDYQYRNLKESLKMSDDDINEMSKYVAKAEPQRQYIQTIPQRQAQYQALQNIA